MLNNSSAARAQGIQWTRPYLVELCDSIRQALEASAGESDENAPDLEEAREAAGKLSATLATLGVPGATALADSLERALGTVEELDSETATVLLESVAVLPDYLERLETGAPDLPEVLADFIERTNRAVGLESQIPEAAGAVGLEALDDEREDEHESLDPADLRRTYQRALRDWLRDREQIEALRSFTQRLQQSSELPLRRLGRVAEAAFSGLAGGQLRPGPDLQSNLAALDQVLHRLGADGASDEARAKADDVALALLEDLKAAEPGCAEIDRITASQPSEGSDEEEMQRARSVLSGRNRQLFTAIAEAARGELAEAKDAINEFLLGRDTESPGIGDQAALLRSVAESFGMLGLERLKERVEAQADRLGELTADPENPALLDVARELLLVESELDEAVLFLGEAPESDLLEGGGQHLPKAEHRRVMRQLLSEALDDLGQAKHLLDQVHRGQGDGDGVEQANRILRRVAGVLYMAGQENAAEMLDASAERMGDVLAEKADAEGGRSRLEGLAEALVVVEFYLDSLTRLDDRGVEYLHEARQRLIALGYLEEDVTPEEEVAAEPAPAEEAESAEEAAPGEEPETVDFAELDAEEKAEEEKAGEAEEAPSEETEGEEPEAVDFADLAEEPSEPATEPSPEVESEEGPEPEPEAVDFAELDAVSATEEAETPEAAEGEEPEGEEFEAPGEEAAETEEAQGEEREAFEPETIEFEPDEVEEAAARDDEDLEEHAPKTIEFETGEFEEPEAEEPEAEEPEVAEPEAGEPEAGEPETGEAEEPAMASALADEDFDLMSIFLEEFDEELAALRQRYPEWREQPTNQDLLTDIRRSFHTLKGSGRMAGAEEIGEFAWEVEQMLNRTLDGQHQPEDVVDLTGEAIEMLPGLRARLTGEPAEIDAAGIEELKSRIASVGEEAELPELEGLDPTLIQLMIKEIGDHLETIDRWIEASRESGWPADVDRDLIRSVHTIKGTLRLAPIGDEAESMQMVEEYLQELLDTDTVPRQAAVGLMEDLRTMLGKRLERLQRKAVSTDHFDTAHLATEARTLISGLHHEEREPPARPPEPVEEPDEADLGVEEVPELEAEETHFDEEVAEPEPPAAEESEAAESEEPEAGEAEAGEAEAEEPEAEEPEAGEAEAEEAEEAEAEETGTAETEIRFEEWPDTAAEVETPAEPAAVETANVMNVDYAALDEELLELFQEEGQELLDHSDGLLQEWRENPEDRQLVTALQRDIHTVKGSARMAGLNPIGEVAHVLEDLLESIAGGQQQATSESIDTLEAGCDHLHAMLEAVEKREPLPVQSAEEALETEDTEFVEPETTVPETGEVAEPETARTARTGAIRLTGDQVEELLNFAGEVSIFRSRIEQEIGAFRGNIGEVEQTTARLREQLRKLEQETEAQILSRYEREHGMPDSTFDPLELDRYSTIQQLSRALAESVSDLNSLTELMDDAGRQSETLLMQQARVNTELQEGLMQARMVSFNTLAPRLRRVVRNAARDLDRKAELRIEFEGEGELDRNVLDRVTAPIEHILRNAVAHGIENPDQRRAAGKPETGTITITIDREATELLIRVADDGSGLKLDLIRERALEKGLLTRQQADDADQLAQVIFNTGFSTAEEVSELAGRGVGMDVVSSEVRQIGGRIAVNTEADRGTRFTMRIPLSLAVMQAIFVTAGERLFAIPLQAVRGVARIQPDEWREALDAGGTYRYGGEDYPLLELEPQLGFEPVPIGDESLSLLMIEAGEERGAIRVADIEGHREIVLKPVGPQISSIPGILGGTIMGDGQVVVILDVAPMIENALAERRLPGMVEVESVATEEEEAKRTPLVMVVDDSITMRRVTSRILEHHGLEVITARDGVDAVDQLYERVPDLMLLDIEMPRMDGFELAAHVRDDSRLADIPIMMITSRSGDKHREHARKLGVDRYLIKPYQEANMVRNVFEMLDMPVPGDEE
ncbi:MAG: Hpt domain-containing protein [Candidatus Wenzhouxiangella sp. M2_3B_020]